MRVDDYDEFASIDQLIKAKPADHPFRVGAGTGGTAVRRRQFERPDGQRVSLLQWGGDEQPPLVFIHGGSQNAHTWDMVITHLGRPAVALDMPGHGHSSWRADRDYRPRINAEAMAAAIDEVAPDAPAVIGMSAGGLTSIALAASRPDLVRKLVIVDVTPNVGLRNLDGAGPRSLGPNPGVAAEGDPSNGGGYTRFASFDEILAATAQRFPERAPEYLAIGIRHNAREEPDGSWIWRYDRTPTDPLPDHRPLWDDLAAIKAPIMLVRGALSPLVRDEDIAEVRAVQPNVRIEIAPKSPHAVQSAEPELLADLIANFVG